MPILATLNLPHFVLISTIALGIGFGLDLLVGDPPKFPHLVRLIGNVIDLFEQMLYRLQNKLVGGLFLVLAILIICFTVVTGLLLTLWRISPWLYLIGESFICWQSLALTSLRQESAKVSNALTSGDLAQSRLAVSMIVGRDTAALDATGITKATVETIAENASDGVIAPLFFLALGGGIGGVLYKCVNTMDSMIGYQTERYQLFGRVAAKLDDVLNYIPARLTALLFVVAAFALRLDGVNAWQIWRRDRKNHKSPNSAHPEAAVAGALSVQLAGDAYYFGKLVAKPHIGDDTHPIQIKDIHRAHKLLQLAAWIMFVLVLLVRGGIYATL